MTFSIFDTILYPHGPFDCFEVLYFPFGLSPNNWALSIDYHNSFLCCSPYYPIIRNRVLISNFDLPKYNQLFRS